MTNRMPLRIRLLIALLLSCAHSHAQLDFEFCKIEKTASPLENEFEFEFPFKNLNDEEVVISKIEPSCSCVSASCKKTSFEKSDSGKIVGKISIAGKVGKETQSVVLTTNYGAHEKKVVLSIDFTVPNILIVKPSLLLWRINDPCDYKLCTITLDALFISEIVEIVSDSDDFAYSFHRSEEEDHAYVLKMKPLSTSACKRALIHIKAKAVDNSVKTYFVHAMIK